MDWHQRRGLWRARMKVNNQEIFGGYHRSELDAGRAVNKMCIKANIPQKNPELMLVSQNQAYEFVFFVLVGKIIFLLPKKDSD